MKLQIECSAEETTNGMYGYAEKLTFGLECDIRVIFDKEEILIPFDTWSLEAKIDEAKLSEEQKKELIKDDFLNIKLSEIMGKTIENLHSLTRFSMTT